MKHVAAYTAEQLVQEQAERLLSYWEIHGDDPETVAKWAFTDLMGFLRFFAEGDES